MGRWVWPRHHNTGDPGTANGGGSAQPLLSVLPGGPTTAQIANPAGLQTSSGAAVTCTRSTAAYCQKSTSFDAAQILPNAETYSFWGAGGASSSVSTQTDSTGIPNSLSVVGTVTGSNSFVYGYALPAAVSGPLTASIDLKSVSGATTVYLGLWDEGSNYFVTAVNLTTSWQRFSVTTTGTTAYKDIVIGFDPAHAASATPFSLLAARPKIEQPTVGAPQPNTSSGWGVLNSGSVSPTLTPNALAAPDGTTTATRIDFGAVSASGNYSLSNYPGTSSTLGNTYTLSMYVYSASAQTFYFECQGAFTQHTSAAIPAGAWTLVSMTGTAGSTGANTIYLGPEYNYQGAVPAQTFYVWGVRLDQGSSRGGGYTSPMLVSLPANTPRVEANGLLVEGAGTNICLQSQTFDNATWTKIGSTTAPTVTADQVIAPDGTLTADKVVFPAVASGYSLLRQNVTNSAGTYTFSVWIYSTVATSVYIAASANGATYASCSVLANTWTRFTNTATLALNDSVDIGWNMPATGAGSGATLYLWGAQLEANPFATSYVPTTTASANRGAEIISVANPLLVTSGWYVGATVTPQASAAWSATSGNAAAWSIGTTFSANSVYSQVRPDGNCYTWVYDNTGTSAYGFAAEGFSAGSTHRIIQGLNGSTPSTYFDGVAQSVTLGGTGTRTLSAQQSNFYLGCVSGGFQLYGWLSNIKIGTTQAQVQ